MENQKNHRGHTLAGYQHWGGSTKYLTVSDASLSFKLSFPFLIHCFVDQRRPTLCENFKFLWQTLITTFGWKLFWFWIIRRAVHLECGAICRCHRIPVIEIPTFFTAIYLLCVRGHWWLFKINHCHNCNVLVVKTKNTLKYIFVLYKYPKVVYSFS